MKQRLADEQVSKLLANRTFSLGQKPWAMMNESERKLRVKQLWIKARMFVRMRKVLSAVNNDAEDNFVNDMMDQAFSDVDVENCDNFDTLDESEVFSEPHTLWY